jgi:hypothetical protein
MGHPVMNRKEFLRKLGSDLLETVAHIAHPLIEDDLEKMERLMDRVSGLRWHPLPNSACKRATERAVQVEEIFIAGHGVFLVVGEELRSAFGKECSECRTVVHWLPHVGRFKCFLCNKELSPLDETGDLKLRSYPVKEKDGTWYVGLKE